MAQQIAAEAYTRGLTVPLIPQPEDMRKARERKRARQPKTSETAAAAPTS